MAPLTEPLKGKKRGKVVFKAEYVNAFNKIKEIVEEYGMLHFTDFNEVFFIYTDSSEFQMGAIITQNERIIAF